MLVCIMWNESWYWEGGECLDMALICISQNQRTIQSLSLRSSPTRKHVHHSPVNRWFDDGEVTWFDDEEFHVLWLRCQPQGWPFCSHTTLMQTNTFSGLLTFHIELLSSARLQTGKDKQHAVPGFYATLQCDGLKTLPKSSSSYVTICVLLGKPYWRLLR